MKPMKDDPAYQKLVSDVACTLRGVQELCRQHGIFDGLRELLCCPECGLMEDVAFDGRSVCPDCGTEVVIEEEDDDIPCS